MPGGQTSRACDQCRKRKKKCDLVQPVCGRCQLLKIPCINCNTQRWKFQHQRVRGSASTSLSQAVTVRHALEAPIPQNLDNSNSRTAARLLSICEISDLSYDIHVYGDFFRFIPRRLGTNQALDAVVWAFVCAHPSLYTKHTSTDALAAYGVALKAVANSLGDEDQRKSPDLLCALQLLNIIQGWISKPTDQYVHFFAIISHLLPDMIEQNWTDPFEYAQLIAASILVIVTSMFTNLTVFDTSILGPFLKRHIVPRPNEGKERRGLSSFGLYQLMLLPLWMRAPTEYVEEMRDAYDQVKFDLQVILERTTNLESTTPPPQPSDDTDKGKKKDDVDWQNVALARLPGTKMYRVRALYQASRTLFLSIAIFLNSLLRATQDPFDQNGALATETGALTEDVIEVATEMLPIRPLFSSGVTMTIVVAWGADANPARREKLATLMAQHQLESIGTGWVSGGKWWETYLARLKQRAGSVAQEAEDEQDGMAADNEKPDKTFNEVVEEKYVHRCTIL